MAILLKAFPATGDCKSQYGYCFFSSNRPENEGRCLATFRKYNITETGDRYNCAGKSFHKVERV